jgi:three-Cys-motif partner protein
MGYVEDAPQLSFDLGLPRERVVKPPKFRLVTADGQQLVIARGHGTLVQDMDGLVSRIVKPHSSKKAHAVRRYAGIVSSGMKDGWFGDKRWWLELCSGPGQLWEDDSGTFIPGSPLDVLTIPHPFTGCVFVEYEEECAHALGVRTAAYPKATVLQGDCNDELLLDRIRQIIPEDALLTIYADAEDLDDVNFDTIKYFTKRYGHVDWWINYPGPGAARYIRAGGESRAVPLLGHDNPRQILEVGDGAYAVRLLAWYRANLENLGYKVAHETIFGDKNSALYELVFATRD